MELSPTTNDTPYEGALNHDPENPMRINDGLAISIPSRRSVSINEMNLAEYRHFSTSSPLIRFKETDEQYHQLKLEAELIFSEWDVLQDGVITITEIEQSQSHGFDKEFAVSLLRVLDSDNTSMIHRNEFINCMNVLTYGTLAKKLELLLKFLNKSSENDSLSSDEVAIYFQYAPRELLEKLGLVEKISTASSSSLTSPPLDPAIGTGRSKRMITCRDIISLFENSDRGEEAIDIFCRQIIRILKKPLLKSQRVVFRANSATALAAATCAASSSALHTIRKLFNVEKSSVFIFILICLQIALWVYNFLYYRHRDFPLPYSIAKGSGLNLRILSIFLFLSMARSTMGALYSFSTFRRFIPMGFNIQIHSFCGFSVVLHSLVHMIGHIIYHETHVKGGFSYSFKQPSLLRGASWDKKGSGDGITGYILMGSLFLMAGTALFRSWGSKAYNLFSFTHFLYNGWLIFLCLHVPHLWPYFVFVGILFLAERLYDFLHLTIHSTLAYSRPGNNGVTFLSVPTAGTKVYPGSYYRIKVPAISAVEWHPFSLASSVASHHLTFFVASTGDWTKELYRLVSDSTLRDSIVIQVQGPFVAPAFTVSKKSTELNLLVASGIGITPFFSLMATKVAEEQNYESDRQIYASLFQENIDHRGGSFTSMKALKQWGFLQSPVKTIDIEQLHVVWTIREVSELLFYINYVSELVKHQQSFEHPVVFVEVYLTGLGNSTDVRYLMAQTLLILSLSSKSAASSSQYMKIHFGRPDCSEIISKLSPQNVYYCGGKVLKESLKDICLEKKIKFHPEDFDSGGSVVTELIETVKKCVTFESKATKISKARQRRNTVTGIPPTPKGS
jgi:hypothetical protein